MTAKLSVVIYILFIFIIYLGALHDVGLCLAVKSTF